MERKKKYIESFNKASMEKKIKSIKAIEKYGKLNHEYIGVSRQIDSIASSLDAIYPGNWDILLSLSYSKLRKRLHDKYFTIEFVIHFPEICITNSKNIQHIIRDLYVKLDPYKNVLGEFTFQGFTGKRMSATKSEIYNRYQHSHISGRRYTLDDGDDPFTFRKFCLGESEIKQVLTMLSSSYEEGRFKLFLMQLGEYLNWESIEGTPYMYIGYLSGGGEPEKLGEDDVKEYYKELMEREVHPKLDFHIRKDTVRISDNEKLEEFIKLYPSTYNYDSRFTMAKDARGIYYQYRVLPEIEYGTLFLSSKEDLEKISFIFRGELVKFKIIEEEGDNESKPFYIHKQIKDYVKTQLEQKIKKTRLRDHITKQLNTLKNYKEDIRQDRLFVPKN